LAALPWFFSWTGVVLAIAGVQVFGSLGINLCYHRLLTHRSLTCPKWLEHGFAILGICSMQDTPARWVAVHRRHHEHADRREDPHSPLVSFAWSHVGWMLVQNRDLARLGIYERYAKDVLRDPFYRRLERKLLYPIIALSSWAVFFLGGVAATLLGGDSAMEAAQFGASLLVWGVFVRVVAVWHITWSVNSAAHLWGYRNYETDNDSRNNWFRYKVQYSADFATIKSIEFNVLYVASRSKSKLCNGTPCHHRQCRGPAVRPGDRGMAATPARGGWAASTKMKEPRGWVIAWPSHIRWAALESMLPESGMGERSS